MSGHWTPGWDSPAGDFSGEPTGEENFDPDNFDPEFEAQLAEVAAFLAAMPDPVMPSSVEARISAAIAAEAAGAEGAESARTRSEVADLSALRESRVRRSHARQRWLSKVLVPVAACLVLVGGGFFFASLKHDSSDRMSANSSGTQAGPAVSAGLSAGPSTVFGSDREATAGSADRGVPAAAAPEASASSSSPSSAVSFVVTMSGTKYAAATLVAQAKAEMASYPSVTNSQALASAPLTYPGVSGTVPGTSTAFSLPAAGLFGCVEHFTDGSTPRLVDRGTYRGTPAYVIVGESKVWVVGLGCTASRPELLASAALAG